MRERNVGTLDEFEVFGICRRRAGLHQRAIADLAGVHQPRISQWERGQQQLNDDVIERIWGAFDELVAGAGADADSQIYA